MPLKGTIDLFLESNSIRRSYIYNGGDNNKIFIKKNSIIEDSEIHLSGSNNSLEIGENVVIRKATIRLADDNSSIVIGDGFSSGYGMGMYAFEGSEIRIGNNVLFANQIVVRSSDGHSIYDSTSNDRIRTSKDILIGDHTWIGDNSYILKGSHVGKDCIIGCCSVVTSGEYEDNSIYVGNPCRKVREKIYWKMER